MTTLQGPIATEGSSAAIEDLTKRVHETATIQRIHEEVNDGGLYPMHVNFVWCAFGETGALAEVRAYYRIEELGPQRKNFPILDAMPRVTPGEAIRDDILVIAFDQMSDAVGVFVLARNEVVATPALT